MARRLTSYWPAALALLAAGVYATSRLAAGQWDPRSLATVMPSSQTWSEHGYDGQFAYFMAMDPDPSSVAEHLDVPAYRFQRILFPLLARALAFGREAWIPWTLLLVNLVAHAIGTAAVVRLVADRGVWEGFAITYGLWVGLIAGVGLDLTEPLAFALVAAGWLLHSRGKTAAGYLVLGLAAFAKETCLLFFLAVMLSDAGEKRIMRSLVAASFALSAFAFWQVWLWATFGSPGLASGGALATAFEWIPFLGLLRVGSVSLKALGLYVIVFGPTIILPAVWAGLTGIRKLIRREWSPETWSMALHAGAIAFLPFSTFREPLGLVRFASGMVLSVLLYASLAKHRRALVFGLFWTALLAILVNQ